MAKISKNVIALTIVVVCVAGIAGFKYFQDKAHQVLANPSHVQKLPQRAKGNPNANIKIIEFIDFQCPACANGSKLLHDYMDTYPGKMYVELRYFPLKMHQHGLLSAKWGECAARQEKFWPFLNQLLLKQPEWSVLIDPIPAFTDIAKNSNIDLGALNKCLTDPGLEKVIQADQDEGQLRNVSSTPSYFINHEIVVGTKSLKSKLDELLKGEVAVTATSQPGGS